MDAKTSQLNKFLQSEAKAKGLSVEELLASLQESTQTQKRKDCLRPDEVETFDQLPEERRQHTEQCSFCSVLVEISAPNADRAEIYADRAAQSRVRAEPRGSIPSRRIAQSTR